MSLKETNKVCRIISKSTVYKIHEREHWALQPNIQPYVKLDMLNIHFICVLDYNVNGSSLSTAGCHC